MPTAVAIQWVDATTPKVPSISGRVVKGLGLMLPAMSACPVVATLVTPSRAARNPPVAAQQRTIIRRHSQH